MVIKKYKKQIILLFSLILLLALFLSAMSKTQMQENSNDKKSESTANVMEIHSTEDYLNFSESVGNGNDYENWEISLCCDLDFSSSQNMSPVGYRQGTEPVTFLGTFNGNGHRISGLSIHTPEQNAGMFARLGGVVKNLWMDACEFSGERCGTVAAVMDGGAILNCYLDASVEGNQIGSITAVLDGNIENCVASTDEFYGAIRSGQVDNCFTVSEYDAATLNNNLMYLGQSYQDMEWNCWENTEEGLTMTDQKAVLLSKITTKLPVDGRDIELNGHYSFSDRKWCIALPAGFSEKEIQIEIETSSGSHLTMTKSPLDQEIYCIQGDLVFPITFLSAKIDTLYIALAKEKDLAYVNENKLEEIPGIVTMIDTEGNTSNASLQGFYGHGNDSWSAEKKSYNMKFTSPVDLFGMGADEDYALLAGYRRNSLMSYVITAGISKELGFEYAQDFRLVNLYVSGEYAGVYYLAEKVKLDQNRVDITSVFENTKLVNRRRLDTFKYQSRKDNGSSAEQYFYNIPNNPGDITGGYLLEIDIEDYGQYDSRFVTERGVGVVLKRARYSSKEQVAYISGFWQEFEEALFSEDGKNSKGRYYTEYIDLESFAMQWLMYELEQEISLNSSIYYYKESDIDGDGLIHACQPWDVESSYILEEMGNNLWMTGAKEKTLSGYWSAFYKHEDFRREVYRLWTEKFIPVIDVLLESEPTQTESGLKNLSWYRYHIVDVHKLEKSRWRSMSPWEKVNEIEEFLILKKEVLSGILIQ